MNNGVFIKAQNIRLTVVCVVLLFSVKAQQNLVLNGGFEDTLWCYPCGNFQITKFNHVTNPTLGSPDGYHHYCYNPTTFYPTRSRSGWGRIGIFAYQFPGLNIREYVQMAIQDSLIINKRYCYTSYFRTINPCQYITSSVGIKFFNSAQYFNNINPILLPPDIQNPNSNLIDTASFIIVKGLYTAGGGYNYWKF